MEEKRKARAQQEELKKAKRAEKKKQKEEKKRMKETEAALRKEVQLEESRKDKSKGQNTRKKPKVSRKLYDDEWDTSVGENAMFLDDNSSDEYEIDCVSDESTGILHVDSKVRVDDKENGQGQENDTSITVHVEGQEEEIDTADILNQLELASDTTEQLDEGSARNLWHALSVDYIM